MENQLHVHMFHPQTFFSAVIFIFSNQMQFRGLSIKPFSQQRIACYSTSFSSSSTFCPVMKHILVKICGCFVLTRFRNIIWCIIDYTPYRDNLCVQAYRVYFKQSVLIFLGPCLLLYCCSDDHFLFILKLHLFNYFIQLNN